MFSKFDNSSIKNTQWIVRQFELLTPIDHSRMARILGLVHLNTCFFLSIILLQMVFVSLKIPGGLLLITLLTIIYTLMMDIQMGVQKILTRKITRRDKTSSLPEEIITRKKYRCFHIVCLVLVMLFSWAIIDGIGTIIAKENKSEELFATLFFILTAIVSNVFLTTCIEYFLCTTPLPPDEKERKKQEREMRGMRLQKIRG